MSTSSATKWRLLKDEIGRDFLLGHVIITSDDGMAFNWLCSNDDTESYTIRLTRLFTTADPTVVMLVRVYRDGLKVRGISSQTPLSSGRREMLIDKIGNTIMAMRLTNELPFHEIFQN